MISVTLAGLQALSDDLYLLQLKPEQSMPVFQAGQYLSLQVGDLPASYFSIASAPSADLIELHVQAGLVSQSAQELLQALQQQQPAKVSLPAGDCHYQRLEDAKQLILICSGTGFSQMQSVVQHWLELQDARPLSLYWSARHADGLYRLPLVDQWQRQAQHFRYSALINPRLQWNGMQGALDAIILAENPDLCQAGVMVCGSAPMVWHTHDVLAAAGLPAGRIFSDVFAFQPRGNC